MQLLLAVLLMLFPNIAFMLAGFSSDMLSGDTTENMLLSVFIYGMLNYCTIVVLTSFVLNTLDSDINSGWAKMERTMPVSGGQIIGGKLLATLAVIGIMTLISLVFNVISIFLYGLNVEIMIAMPICFGLMQVVTLSPSFPIAMKIGAKFVTAIYIGILIVVTAALVVLVFAAFSGDISAAVLRAACYGVLPLASAAAFFLSYKAGEKVCMEDM
jgi:hypothetical protein